MSSSIGPRSTWSEVLRLVNRSGNRPSHEGAAEEADEVIDLCHRAGFRKIVLRGDTAFSSSEQLDAWDEDGVTFYFGFKAMGNLEEIAENLPENAWKTRQRGNAAFATRSGPRRAASRRTSKRKSFAAASLNA